MVPSEDGCRAQGDGGWTKVWDLHTFRSLLASLDQPTSPCPAGRHTETICLTWTQTAAREGIFITLASCGLDLTHTSHWNISESLGITFYLEMFDDIPLPSGRSPNVMERRNFEILAARNLPLSCHRLSPPFLHGEFF